MPRSSPGRAGVLLTLVLAGMSMLGPFSIDTPFPAFAQMRGDFGVGAEQMQLVVSAYMLAFAVMTPFHGPLSDAIGRKPVIIGALTAYAMASVGCALSPNLSVLLFFRVLQGLSAGGSTIIGRTIIRGPEMLTADAETSMGMIRNDVLAMELDGFRELILTINRFGN